VAKEEILASLDAGTGHIKCVVGLKHADGAVDVIGTGSHPAVGLKAGRVCNRQETVESLRQAVNEAAMMGGCVIKEVYASVSGQHVRSFNSEGVARIRGGRVTEETIANVIDVAQAVRIPAEREFLHVIPQRYVIDGQKAGTRPLGMKGVRLEMRAHVVTGAASSVSDLSACIRSVGLRVADVVFSPLAAAETLLTPACKELGVLLIDLGAATTDIAVFKNGSIMYSSVFGVGGEHITADIQDCLGTPTVEAERLKQAHGCALASLASDQEVVELPGVGGRRAREIRRALLCEIIEARVAEILKMIGEDLERVGLEDELQGGIVMTGGTANMPGIMELANQVLKMPAQRGEPHRVEGLIDVVRNPRYATSTGLILCAARGKHRDWFTPSTDCKRRSVLSRVFSWLPGMN